MKCPFVCALDRDLHRTHSLNVKTSKSVSESWNKREAALYLCLLYIYVISSMYKEVIIKLVEWQERESEQPRMCVSALYKRKHNLSLLESLVLYFA